jgi:hypothetical protein
LLAPLALRGALVPSTWLRRGDSAGNIAHAHELAPLTSHKQQHPATTCHRRSLRRSVGTDCLRRKRALYMLMCRVILHADGPDQTTESTMLLSHKSAQASLGSKQTLKRMFKFWDNVNKEDIAICTSFLMDRVDLSHTFFKGVAMLYPRTVKGLWLSC